MGLPFELDRDSFQHESVLAGAGLDVARALALPEDKGARILGAWAEFIAGLSVEDRLLVHHWVDVFHPTPFPPDVSHMAYDRRPARPERRPIV